MMKIIVDDIEYEIIENYRDCYDKELLLEKITDYFYDYDYILGDFAYGKLRLKGFCNKDNPKFNKINDINNKEKYFVMNHTDKTQQLGDKTIKPYEAFITDHI